MCFLYYYMCPHATICVFILLCMLTLGGKADASNTHHTLTYADVYTHTMRWRMLMCAPARRESRRHQYTQHTLTYADVYTHTMRWRMLTQGKSTRMPTRGWQSGLRKRSSCSRSNTHNTRRKSRRYHTTRSCNPLMAAGPTGQRCVAELKHVIPLTKPRSHTHTLLVYEAFSS